jgi:PEP-CTERM motif
MCTVLFAVGIRPGFLFVVGCLFALCAVRSAQAITLNFSNLDETDVAFSGGAFSFSSVSNSDPYQFDITSVSGGGDGDSVGDDGYVTPGGPFTIGAITISGPEQTAPVTGTGVLHITDANNVDLTGSLMWDNITTYGVGGILNLTGVVNLTSITYGGTGVDLGTLANGGSASDVVTFQFVPAMTLTQLVASSASTSYSGSISNSSTSVPEPASVSLLGLGALSLLSRRRRE